MHSSRPPTLTQLLGPLQPLSPTRTLTDKKRILLSALRPKTTTNSNQTGQRPKPTLSKSKSVNSNKSEKSVKSNQEDKRFKFQLKETLGRIGLMKSNRLINSDREVAQCSTRALGLLSQCRNFYSNQFQFIQEEVRRLIFLQANCLPKKLVQFCDNQQLTKFSSERCIEQITWKEVTAILANQFLKLILTHEEHLEKSAQTINQLQATLAGKVQRINTLKKQILYYSVNPNESLAPLVEDLQKQVKERDKDINKLNRQLKERKDEIDMLKATNSRLSQRIQVLKSKIYDLQLLQKAKSKEMPDGDAKNFQKEVSDLKQMLDKSIIRLVAMKDQYQKVKKLNFDLVSERSELAKRAAVGFSELTPRPNYKALFSSEGLSFDSITKGIKKKISTEAFLRMLIGRFKEVYQQLKFQNKSKKIQLDVHGNPLNRLQPLPTDLPVDAQLSEVAKLVDEQQQVQIDRALAKFENEPKDILNQIIAQKDKIASLQKKHNQMMEKQKAIFLRLNQDQ